ncbi:MAG: hypothetical protein WDZ27_02360 [Waddliaceae bacterium]
MNYQDAGIAYTQSRESTNRFTAISFATFSVALLTGLIINANGGSKSTKLGGSSSHNG